MQGESLKGRKKQTEPRPLATWSSFRSSTIHEWTTFQTIVKRCYGWGVPPSNSYAEVLMPSTSEFVFRDTVFKELMRLK